MKRSVFAAVTLLAALAFAPSAFAGGYTDASYLTPVGKVGVPYYHVIAWRPGQGCPPYSYHLDPGNRLPPGLSLDVGSGKITGTPTKEGSYTFYVSQIDQCGVEGQGNSPFTIKIEGSAPAPAPLTVTTSSLKIATTGIAYAATLTASGGSSLTWSLAGGSLPSGLQLASNGTIGGTPTAVGSSTFTVKVSDGSRSSTKQLTLRVIAPFAVASPAMEPGEVGRPFTASLSATGGIMPYTWTLASGAALPAGLTLDAGLGTISGVPEVAGSFRVRITAADSNGSTTTLELSLPIRAKLAVATTRLPAASAGRTYRVRLAHRGGVGPLTWKLAGHVPRGLRLDVTTGTLRGKPRAAGTYRFTVVVTDALGARTTRAFRLTVRR